MRIQPVLVTLLSTGCVSGSLQSEVTGTADDPILIGEYYSDKTEVISLIDDVAAITARNNIGNRRWESVNFEFRTNQGEFYVYITGKTEDNQIAFVNSGSRLLLPSSGRNTRPTRIKGIVVTQIGGVLCKLWARKSCLAGPCLIPCGHGVRLHLTPH